MSSPDGPIHVLCTRDFTDDQLSRLKAVSPRLVISQRMARNRAELMAVLTPETEVLFASYPPDSLEKLPALRWMQFRSAGLNTVVGTPVWQKPDIAITSASGIHAPSMAEYTLGMMIALARDFAGFLSFQRRSCWPMSPKNHVEQFPGRELRGSTVLIVGYGSIGREIGRQCHALGLRVLAIKRDPTQRADSGYRLPGTGDPLGEIPEEIGGPDDLDRLLPQAEYVVLVSASTSQSRGMISAAQLQRMRPDAFLINIGRGNLVDEDALVQALRERRIAGAGLDVFVQEPLPADHPLWSLENVIVSPHVSGVSPRYDDHMAELFAENLRRYVAGETLLNLADRNFGY